MSEVLVVGVDGSDSSYRAVDFAVARAQASDASVVLAAVVPWSPFQIDTPQENERRHPQREEELAYARDTVLAPGVERCEAGGVPCETVATHGHPAKTLADLAGSRGAAHVLVGRTGESKLHTLLFGSVPASLVQLSPVPVTVVP